MSMKLNRYSLISSLENLKVCYCITGGEKYKSFNVVYIKLVDYDDIPATCLSINIDNTKDGNILKVSICNYGTSWNDIINIIESDILQAPKYNKPLPKSVLDDILGSMYSSIYKNNERNIHITDYDKEKLRSYIRNMRINYGYGNSQIPICVNFSDESNSPFLLITINENNTINHMAYYDRSLSGKKSIMINAAIRKYNDLLLEDVYDEIITTIYRLKNSRIGE